MNLSKFKHLRLDQLLMVFLTLIVGVLVAAVLALGLGRVDDHEAASQDRAEVAELRDDSRRLNDTISDLTASLSDVSAALGRRTPSLQFFVCWAAHVGDYLVAIPDLGGSGEISPENLERFKRIAQAVRDALRPVAEGGCADDALPVDVPAPTKLTGP